MLASYLSLHEKLNLKSFEISQLFLSRNKIIILGLKILFNVLCHGASDSLDDDCLQELTLLLAVIILYTGML